MELLHVKLCENLFDVGRQFCLKREKKYICLSFGKGYKVCSFISECGFWIKSKLPYEEWS